MDDTGWNKSHSKRFHLFVLERMMSCMTLNVLTETSSLKKHQTNSVQLLVQALLVNPVWVCIMEYMWWWWQWWWRWENWNINIGTKTRREGHSYFNLSQGFSRGICKPKGTAWGHIKASLNPNTQRMPSTLIFVLFLMPLEIHLMAFNKCLLTSFLKFS